MKLEPEFKIKWIEALRSGEYTQSKHALYNPEEKGFCCLGVAGHLCGIPTQEMYHSKALLYNEELSRYSIPEFLKSDILSEAIQRELVERNDRGMSFKEIADYIEENL